MPYAQRYIPDLNGSEARTIEAAFDEERRARSAVHQVAWNYYDGKHREPLKPDGTGTNDNLIINRVESVVDKDVAANVGVDDAGVVKGVHFDIVDQPDEQGFVGRVMRAARRIIRKPEQVSRDQAYLDAVWRANKSALLLLDALTNGSIMGHVFIKIVPEGRETDDGISVPRLINLHASNVTVFWDQADVERVLWYRIEFGEDYHKTRQDIVREVDEDGSDGVRWLILNYSNVSGRWELTSEDVWAYSWPPIIDWKNLPAPNQYYGKADVGKIGRLNDGLNFLLSNMQRILKHHAHPKTIATGVGASGIEATAVDGLWAIGAAEAKVYNLEMQSDLASTMSLAELVDRTIYDLSRVVNLAQLESLNTITNFVMRVRFHDALGKLGVKRLLAGEALQRLCRHLLELGGFNPRVMINVVWPDPLPTDLGQLAQALESFTRIGLSNETALERAGFDPDQEAKRKAEQMQNLPQPLRDAMQSNNNQPAQDGDTPDEPAMMNRNNALEAQRRS